MSDVILGNLYNINKEAMKQFSPYDPIALNRICQKVVDDIWDAIWQTAAPYWMLLCRERNDYTVFRLEESKKEFFSALKECLTNRGKVLDITKQEDSNYEIWIRDFDTDENVVYYLFNYTNAVIEV